MPERTLSGCHILVVEDEFLLADNVQAGLSAVGAVVLGPVGTLEDALKMIGWEQRIDGAVLDINLCGEPAYPLADLLMQRGVPVVFTTGYDEGSLPARFAHVACCPKPTTIRLLTETIGRVIHP